MLNSQSNDIEVSSQNDFVEEIITTESELPNVNAFVDESTEDLKTEDQEYDNDMPDFKSQLSSDNNKSSLSDFKDLDELADWLDKALSEEFFPPWSESNSASIERVLGYLDNVSKKVSRALRNDIHRKLTPKDIERIDTNLYRISNNREMFEKRLDWLRRNSNMNDNMKKSGELKDKVDEVGRHYIDALEERQKYDNRERFYPSDEELKRQKEAPQSQNEILGYCEHHAQPKYEGECLLCTGQFSEEYAEDTFIDFFNQAYESAVREFKAYQSENGIKKEAATPRVEFIVPPFIHAICTIMMESKAQAGHNIEEVYHMLKKKYKIDDREELEVLHTLRNMGYVYFLDRSGTEFLKNYLASAIGLNLNKVG